MPSFSLSGRRIPTVRAASTVLLAGVAVSLALVVSSVISVVNALPASAHAELVKITPGMRAQLTTAPTEVVLEFSETVSTSFATLVVTNAAGLTVARGRPTVLGTKVVQALSPGLASGDYRIAYRAVSDDGHAVTGESTFTLTLTATTSPSKSAYSASPPLSGPKADLLATQRTEVPPTGQSGWSTPSQLLAAGVTGLVVICAGALLWRHGRR